MPVRIAIRAPALFQTAVRCSRGSRAQGPSFMQVQGAVLATTVVGACPGGGGGLAVEMSSGQDCGVGDREKTARA
ncbi:MAG TPA: hypothetical protein VGK32_12910 [Vicinamibacterales bacterium]